MQRTFTVEIRVDYADPDKNDTMRTTLLHMARHGYATAALLAEGIKPMVTMWSDDFFGNHEDIALLDDAIQQGIETTNMQDTTDELGSELMAAMRDI